MPKRLADCCELPTYADAAEVVGCGRRLIRELVEAGVLEGIRLGRYVRVKRTSLESLIEIGTDEAISRAKAARGKPRR